MSTQHVVTRFERDFQIEVWRTDRYAEVADVPEWFWGTGGATLSDRPICLPTSPSSNDPRGFGLSTQVAPAFNSGLPLLTLQYAEKAENSNLDDTVDFNIGNNIVVMVTDLRDRVSTYRSGLLYASVFNCSYWYGGYPDTLSVADGTVLDIPGVMVTNVGRLVTLQWRQVNTWEYAQGSTYGHYTRVNVNWGDGSEEDVAPTNSTILKTRSGGSQYYDNIATFTITHEYVDTAEGIRVRQYEPQGGLGPLYTPNIAPVPVPIIADTRFLDVQLDGSNSYDLDGTINGWDWFLGLGTWTFNPTELTSDFDKVWHTVVGNVRYTVGGEEAEFRSSVRLTVADNQGQRKTTLYEVNLPTALSATAANTGEILVLKPTLPLAGSPELSFFYYNSLQIWDDRTGQGNLWAFGQRVYFPDFRYDEYGVQPDAWYLFLDDGTSSPSGRGVGWRFLPSTMFSSQYKNARACSLPGAGVGAVAIRVENNWDESRMVFFRRYMGNLDDMVEVGELPETLNPSVDLFSDENAHGSTLYIVHAESNSGWTSNDLGESWEFVENIGEALNAD